MPTPRNTLEQIYDPGSFPIMNNLWYRKQVGWTGGDKVTPLSYEGLTSRRVVTSVSSGPGWFTLSAGNDYFSNMGVILGSQKNTINRAYEKFRQNALGPTAQIGVTLAEWRESLGMVANRAYDMVKLYRDLRYLRFRDVADRFGHRVVATSRQTAGGRRVRSTAGLWIEWSFGWKPTMSDLFGALKTIEKPLPHGKASGSASGVVERYSLSENAAGRSEFSAIGQYFCKMGAEIRVTNPNLALAAHLGLVNPATIAFEIVPFSFLLDWAFDVSKWLSSFTDFLGCELNNSYTSHFVKGYDSWDKWDFFNGHHAFSKIETYNQMRIPGITTPVANFEIDANLGESWQRAANAVSLLTLVLSGQRPTSRV